MVRDEILDYYCEVQQFDLECGKILATLAAQGELHNTLVVMTSDNGWQLPRGLANCYDLGVRTPLAMRLPGLIKAGQVRDDYVSIGDLAPTFLEAAGLPVPGVMTAASLFSPQRRHAIFLERERHANVRKGDLSFDFCLGKRPAEELYVLKDDPSQVKNVATQPQFAKVKAELAARVQGWMKSTGDPRAGNPHTDFWDRAPYYGAKFKGAPPAN